MPSFWSSLAPGTVCSSIRADHESVLRRTFCLFARGRGASFAGAIAPVTFGVGSAILHRRMHIRLVV